MADTKFDDKCPKELDGTTSSEARMEPSTDKSRNKDAEFSRDDQSLSIALDSQMVFSDDDGFDSHHDSDDMPLSSDSGRCPYEPKFATRGERRRFYRSFYNYDSDDYVKKGTTTFAFIYKDGVMVAADHPFSSEMLVGNVIDLSTHMLATISWGCEDYKTFLIELQKQYHSHVEGKKVSVAEASKWVADYLRCCGEKASSIKLLIAGWDETVPDLYYVDFKGEPRRGTKFNIGSGSYFASSALFRKNYQDMSFDDAEYLAKEALLSVTSKVSAAIRDGDGGEVGGFISAYCIEVDGWKPVFLNEEGGEAEISDGEEDDFPVCYDDGE